MEVFIFGICREIFFFFSEKRGQKLGSVLYMGAHYRRVNTVLRHNILTDHGKRMIRISLQIFVDFTIRYICTDPSLESFVILNVDLHV